MTEEQENSSARELHQEQCGAGPSDLTDQQLRAVGAGRIDRYDQAVAVVVGAQKASASYIQRQLQCGYNEASRYIELMEATGIVSALEYDDEIPWNTPTRRVLVFSLSAELGDRSAAEGCDAAQVVEASSRDADQ